MKNLTKIEKYMKRQIKETIKELNLPSIPVYFNNDSRICFRYRKDRNYSAIHIDSVSMIVKATKEHCNPITHKFFKLNSVHKRINFILYHEIGHYLQCYKHSNWFNKYKKESVNAQYSNSYMTNREYRALRLEHNADKLASSILKRRIKQ